MSRFLSRRGSPTHRAAPCNSASWVPVPDYRGGGHPQASLTQRHVFCLQVRKHPLHKYSSTDNWSPLPEGPSADLCSLGWSRGLGRADDRSSCSGPFCFSSGFQLVVDGLSTVLCFHPLSVLSVFKEPYSKIKGCNAPLLT